MKNASKKPQRGWLIFGITTGVILLLLLGGFTYLRHLPTSTSFRKTLSKSLDQTFHTDTDLLPINWAGSALVCDGLQMHGRPAGRIHTLQASGLRTQPEWRGFLSNNILLSSLTADEVNLKLKNPSAPPEPPPASNSAGRPLTIASFNVNEFTCSLPLTAGWVKVNGTRLSGRKSPGMLELKARGGRFDMGPGMGYSLNSVKGSYQMGTWFVEELNVGDIGESQLKAFGQFESTPGLPGKMNVNFKYLPLSRLFHSLQLPVDAGTVSGSVALRGPLTRLADLRMQGEATFDQDLTRLFPIINKFFTFSQGTQTMRSDCKAAFTYEAGVLTLRNLDLNYGDQLEVRGNLSVSAYKLDGRVLIGLTPVLLNQLPPPVQALFPPASDGRYWTTVQLSGDPSRPLEDLTARVLESMVKEAPQAFEKTVVPTIDAAGELMRQMILPFKQRGF